MGANASLSLRLKHASVRIDHWGDQSSEIIFWTALVAFRVFRNTYARTWAQCVTDSCLQVQQGRV